MNAGLSPPPPASRLRPSPPSSSFLPPPSRSCRVSWLSLHCFALLCVALFCLAALLSLPRLALLCFASPRLAVLCVSSTFSLADRFGQRERSSAHAARLLAPIAGDAVAPRPGSAAAVSRAMRSLQALRHALAGSQAPSSTVVAFLLHVLLPSPRVGDNAAK